MNTDPVTYYLVEDSYRMSGFEQGLTNVATLVVLLAVAIAVVIALGRRGGDQ